MENKNVFVAIALSMAVLLFWGAFFETPKPIDKNLSQQNLENKIKPSETTIVPNINGTVEKKSISRKDSIGKQKRVKIEKIIFENSSNFRLCNSRNDDSSRNNWRKII